MTTLRNWISENELHLDTSVCGELMDSEGRAYEDAQGTLYWACPLLVVQSDPTGTRAMDGEAEANFRDWIDEEGNRPHDLSKPFEVVA